MNMDRQQIQRAHSIKVRAFGVFGRNFATQLSEATSLSREYVSRLLNNKVPHTDALDRLESAVADAEAEQRAEAA